MSTITAIFGGTFDPIHFGHLRVAFEVAELLDATVRMMPAAVPPHREQPGADAGHRLAMLELALRGQTRLIADARELLRSGPSYSIDTVIGLRAELPENAPLVLLVGADAFAGFSTWHRWREIFEHAHVGVLTRPGHGGVFEAELAGEWYARRVQDVEMLRTEPAGAILPIEVTALDLSATMIRDLLREGREPRYLMPDAVVDYIAAQGLYRE